MRLNKHQLIAIIAIICSILWIIVGPWLLTRFSILDLTATGQIGDTIGGITAPIIGLVSAVLIYLSFTAQIRANEIIQEEAKITNTMAIQEANFTYIIEEFERVKLKFEKVEYFIKFSSYNAEGFLALNKVTEDIAKFFLGETKQWDFTDGLKKADYAIQTYALFISEVSNLDLSENQRKIIQSKIWLYFAENVNESVQKMSSWNISKPEKEKSDYVHRAYALKFRTYDIIFRMGGFRESLPS